MGLSKRLLEKQEEVYSLAKRFLIEEGFVEEALDGSLHGKVASDSGIVYATATTYYKRNKQENFTIKEFKDEIKSILDTLVSDDAFTYDLERLN